MLERLVLIACGLGQGVIVGVSVLVIATILDVLPRLSTMFGPKWPAVSWALAFVLGMMAGCAATFFDIYVGASFWFTGLCFLFYGAFVGILILALAETLDFFSVCLGRILPRGAIRITLIALSMSKVVGSLIYWLVPGLWK